MSELEQTIEELEAEVLAELEDLFGTSELGNVEAPITEIVRVGEKAHSSRGVKVFCEVG